MNNSKLSCSIGQYSHSGRKQSNQDFHGAVVAKEPLLHSKGIAVAIADGISSSDVSDVASQSAVKSFLEDYYCTSDTWTVKTAATRVINANNAWLYSQNHRNHAFRLNKDKGYVCTFSALILKSNKAHLFHIGDAQISLLACSPQRDKTDILTQQHRRTLPDGKSFLSKALGVTQLVEIDYKSQAIYIGDVFLLATDGVYEYLSDEFVCTTVSKHLNNLDYAAQLLAENALKNGSDDNLTVQLVKVDSLPSEQSNEFLNELKDLPFPPEVNPRTEFDGYQIIRDIYKSSRSHVVLAKDIETNENLVIKLPSTEGRQNPEYLERFLMEEWISNRLNNPHVVKSHVSNRARSFCYIVSEYVEGQTLAQWMLDNPKPSIAQVRAIIEQVASGLQAFHRQEMLHQDLRPNNIMIDTNGSAKIIDFGSTFVSGVDESHVFMEPNVMPGTAQFLAPEYFLGEFGSKKSDLYSLACITYHMLRGQSPYGTAVAKALTKADQNRMVYQTVLEPNRQTPAWIDFTLKKALHPDPEKRYSELSEFVQDLRKPNPKFAAMKHQPLLERDPIKFWKGVSLVLFLVILGLLSLIL